MTSMLALIALFAASSLLADCSSIKRSSEFDAETMCQLSIQVNCISTLDNKYDPIFTSEQAIAAAVSNIHFMEAMSDDLNSAADCIDQELAADACSGVPLSQSGWDVIRMMADYLGNSTRREIVVAASSSPCLTNPDLLKLLGMPVMECYINFTQVAMLDTCQALNTLETCTVREVALVCGPEGGLFLQSLWDFMEHPESRTHMLNMLEMGEAAEFVNPCFPQVNAVQQMARRAVKAMRK